MSFNLVDGNEALMEQQRRIGIENQLPPMANLMNDHSNGLFCLFVNLEMSITNTLRDSN